MTSLSDYFTLAPQRFQVLGTTTVTGSAATTMTISGLDLSAYTAFKIIGKLKNATASLSLVALYYNSDTTATNYYRQNMAGVGSSTSANRANDGQVIVLRASTNTDFNGEITTDIDGKARALIVSNTNNGSSIEIFHHAHQWTSATNVTGITLSASVASSLAVGSTFTVYGILA